MSTSLYANAAVAIRAIAEKEGWAHLLYTLDDETIGKILATCSAWLAESDNRGI